MDVLSIAGHSFADYTEGHGRNTAIAAPAQYASSYIDFITMFYDLLRRWSSETAFESNLDTITAHSSYRGIVSLGARALPLIVGELRLQPSLLVYALEDITGERPYPPNIQGNIRAMADHWVLWSEREDNVAV